MSHTFIQEDCVDCYYILTTLHQSDNLSVSLQSNYVHVLCRCSSRRRCAARSDTERAGIVRVGGRIPRARRVSYISILLVHPDGRSNRVMYTVTGDPTG